MDTAGHPVAPFDFSFALLLVGTVSVWATWDENYGSQGGYLRESLGQAWHAIRTDRRVSMGKCSLCACVFVCLSGLTAIALSD